MSETFAPEFPRQKFFFASQRKEKYTAILKIDPPFSWIQLQLQLHTYSHKLLACTVRNVIRCGIFKRKLAGFQYVRCSYIQELNKGLYTGIYLAVDSFLKLYPMHLRVGLYFYRIFLQSKMYYRIGFKSSLDPSYCQKISPLPK